MLQVEEHDSGTESDDEADRADSGESSAPHSYVYFFEPFLEYEVSTSESQLLHALRALAGRRT